MFRTKRLMTAPGRNFHMPSASGHGLLCRVQAGQIQSFLCENAGTRQMEWKSCHHSTQASCLKAKKPKELKNKGLLLHLVMGRCRRQKRMVVDRHNFTLNLVEFVVLTHAGEMLISLPWR